MRLIPEVALALLTTAPAPGSRSGLGWQQGCQPPAPARAGVPDALLQNFRGGSGADRDLGLAYAILAQRGDGSGYRSRALALLGPIAESGVDDAEALFIRIDPAQLTGAVSLGAIRMEQGKFQRP